MKKRIIVQNTGETPNSKGAKTADRHQRLQMELRENLKKRKAQARAKKEAGKNG